MFVTIRALSRYGLAGLSLYYLGVYAALALAHLEFPFALEWIEGSMLDHVGRVLRGSSLYCAPSPGFVPSIYPPLYFCIAALAAKVAGEGMAALRLVSVASSIGIFWLLFALVKRETGSRLAGLAAAGLFAATYKAGGPYLDMGRIDTLFLFLFFAGMYVCRFRTSFGGAVAAGLLLACSALTKQTGLVLSLPLIVYCLCFRSASRGVVLALSAWGPAAALTLAINAAHDGWYLYYTLILPGRHAVDLSRIGEFWGEHMLSVLPCSLLLAAAFFALPSRLRTKERAVFYGLVAAAVTGIACMTYIKSGGFKNVLMPVYAVVSMLAGLCLGASIQRGAAPAPPPPWKQAAAVSALLLQFFFLLYNPVRLIPSQDFELLCKSTVSAIGEISGPVFAPANGYLCAAAGKNSSAHIGCINDILRGGPHPVANRLIADIRKALRERRYSAVLLDRKFTRFQKVIERYYRLRPEYVRFARYYPLIKYWYVPKE